jgi:hypothetical protein
MPSDYSMREEARNKKLKRKKEIQYRFAKSYKNTIFNQTKSSITDY